jgi:hypothetical protein
VGKPVIDVVGEQLGEVLHPDETGRFDRAVLVAHRQLDRPPDKAVDEDAEQDYRRREQE